MTAMTFDEMAASPEHWEALIELIRSGQVPEERVQELLRDHGAFAAFYRTTIALPLGSGASPTRSRTAHHPDLRAARAGRVHH